MNNWISVKDRLPTWKDGKVLIYTCYGISVAEKTVNGKWQGKQLSKKQKEKVARIRSLLGE